MSFYQKKGHTDLTGIDEIVISTVGGDFEVEGVEQPVAEITWDVIWEKENCDVEVVRNEKKLIIRFDDKSNIVKFFGITINTSVGNLYKAKIRIPMDTLKKTSISTVSGSIKAKLLKGGRINLSSTSGDITCDDTTSNELGISSKSGDIRLQRIEVEKKCALSSLSGDISLFDIDAAQITCADKSGDIKIDSISDNAQYLSANNVSGDIAVRNIPSEAKINTVSGDIMIKNVYRKVSWITNTVSGDINILTTPIDANITFVSVSGDALFKKRNPTIMAKNEYIFGEGTGGSISAKTVSGDLIIKTEDKGTEPISEKTRVKTATKHDPDAERIVYTYLQGIVTLEEAKEMLQILEYTPEQTDKLIQELREEVQPENQKSTEEPQVEKEGEVSEDEEQSS